MVKPGGFSVAISRSWPSESVSVDLACQRALLAAASEIRQTQKLGLGTQKLLPKTIGKP